MCGICGIVTFDLNFPVDKVILRRMNATLVHRGPDDEGYYADVNAGLGMRRLSIIDLVTGQQPISNETGDIWVIYNGEIYNYRSLRAELEKRGHKFATQTDTEVIVHAYEAFGTDCVRHFNGMFALAVWDARQKRLFLARDRLGIKPLYYWQQGNLLVFGSELKAIMTHPAIPRQIDLAALDHFLSLEYIPGPRTIFENVRKLLPGYSLTFDHQQSKLVQYWDIPFAPITENENSCIERLSELIEDAIRIRLMSDVPLGAFLSGGIDSSTIVAHMSRMTSQAVQTFSIGFDDASYNELPYAQAVADHFNTLHTVEILKPDINDLAVKLVNHQDEPFADTSTFSTYLVSQLASRSVKVVLSGDGGDELFAGYDTYLAERLSRMYAWLPASLRKSTLPTLAGFLPPRPAKKGLVNKIKRLVEGAALQPALQHTRWMIFLNEFEKERLYSADFQQAINGNSAESFLIEKFEQAAAFEPLARQQHVDVKTYLADDILTKVDRMSMAVSLEARVPLLDYRIVEFALNLPPQMKLNNMRTKVILRKAVRGLVPDLVLEKPKQGFSVPIKHWLQGTLKPMMLDLLAEGSLRRRGFFNPETVSTWMRQHLEGRANHSHRLWPLMVFELWWRENLV